MRPFLRRTRWPVGGPIGGTSSVILRTAVRLILPLTFLFAVYAALKGHNGPGGGFIAGLVIGSVFFAKKRDVDATTGRRRRTAGQRYVVLVSALLLCLLSVPGRQTASATLPKADSSVSKSSDVEERPTIR